MHSLARSPSLSPRPLRVAIYARVSTSDQNPEAQLLALREYAATRDFAIHREYVDRISGDAARRRRRAPEFEELMADARRRRFDCAATTVTHVDADLTRARRGALHAGLLPRQAKCTYYAGISPKVAECSLQ